MIVAIANRGDETAHYLTVGLAGEGVDIETLWLDDIMLSKPRWVFSAGAMGNAWDVELADANRVSSLTFEGLLNRVAPEPAPSQWPTATPEDQVYAAQEWRAFLYAVLDAVPGPAVNPPSAGALSGPVWYADAWRFMAGRAGLVTAPPEDSARDVHSVFVVGEQVLGDLDDDIANRSMTLSKSLNCPFHEIFFDGQGRAIGGTSFPTVSEGRDDVVVALAQLFR